MSTIDLTYLESVTDGNKDLMKELIDIFKMQVPEYLDDFKAAYDAKDMRAVGKIAHKAKSSVAIMGMASLVNQLRELEQLGTDNVFKPECQVYIDNFKLSCTEAIEQLDKL